MKRFTVLLPPIVREQIRAQVLYIAQNSINNALVWEDRLRAAIDQIGEAPGHAVDDAATARLGCTIRKCVFEKTYLIHYFVDESASIVRIVNFRHGARLPRSGEP